LYTLEDSYETEDTANPNKTIPRYFTKNFRISVPAITFEGDADYTIKANTATPTVELDIKDFNVIKKEEEQNFAYCLVELRHEIQNYSRIGEPYSNRYGIVVFSDTCTKQDLFEKMMRDDRCKTAHIVIAKWSDENNKMFKMICEDTKLHKQLFHNNTTKQAIDDVDTCKNWRKTHTNIPTRSDGWCGWHSMFLGLKRAGIEQYGVRRPITIEEKDFVDDEGNPKISLGDRCKKNLQMKVQQQANEIDFFGGDSRRDTLKQYMRIDTDIPTIVAALRDQNINLRVEVYSEPGEIAIFENVGAGVYVDPDWTPVTLFVHYNNEQSHGGVGAHFELCTDVAEHEMPREKLNI